MTAPPARLAASRPQPTTSLLFAAGLILLTAALYARTARFDFVNFDDDAHVYQNPHVASGLTAENVRWAFEIHGPSQWHPLAWLSHQLDVALYGLWPGGHHLTNVLWHLANVLMLFLFLNRTTGFVWRSGFVAALFAVHPLNVESVAWVSERRNVLCMGFLLLALLAYASYARRRTVTRYLVVLLLFSLALMSKPLAVTLPCLLLLLDYWPLRRVNFAVHGEQAGLLSDAAPPTSLGFLIAEKVPMLLLSAGASLLTIWCQQGIIETYDVLPFPLRILNALAAYGIYLRQMIWPVGLAVFYPHPGMFADNPFGELLLPALLGGVLLVTVTTWAVTNLRRRPYLAIGWFWYLGTMIPMIGLMQSGRQQLADRYAYLPLIGVFISITWWLSEVVANRNRRAQPLLLAGVTTLCLLSIVTWVQVGYWRDSVSLFERCLAVTEHNSWAHHNLGQALHERGETGRAARHLAASLAIDPQYGLARYNLGIVLHDQGNPSSAIGQFQEAVRLLPGHVGARQRLGIALADVGRLDAAISVFREAVQIDPSVPQSHLNLGLALAREGRQSEANVCFERALALDPANVMARYSLAIGLAQLDQHPVAKRHFRRLLELAPNFALAHNEFGKLLLETGEREAAARHFREAIRLDPRLTEAQLQLQQMDVQ